MNDDVPSVTVLIAARPDQVEILAVRAARALDYPRERLNIIVARGKQPSVQRNVGMRAARGEVIYFLDDDSMPGPESLRRAVAHFRDGRVKMVGGPNLCPPDAPARERIFALVLSSWLAFGPSRARYAPVGRVRASSEKELILCNLLARRETMLALGGFNEALYPNEENALMDEVQKQGGILIYDPQFAVFRRPRHTLAAFARMLKTYGRGRAEQFRVHPTLGSALNFAPPLFCLYLAGLAVLTAIHLLPAKAAVHRAPLGALATPLAGYCLAVLAQAAALTPRGGLGRSLAGPAPLIALTHVLYGYGFWRGLFTPLKSGDQRPAVQVVLEEVPK